MVKEAKEYEKYRAISEMTIHDRLHDLQVIKHRVTTACSVESHAFAALLSLIRLLRRA